MLRELLTGIIHFFMATGFLAKNRLLHYYLYPILIGILFYIGIFTWIFGFSYDTVNWILSPYLPDQLPEMGKLSDIMNVLDWSLYGLITILAAVIVLIVAFRLSKYMVLILLTPVFSLLSERIEEIQNGKEFPFELTQFLMDIIRGILIALRNLSIELLWIAAIGIIGIFAAPLALISTPLLILVGAYFYGFSMMDYTCERRKMGIGESVRFVRNRKWFAIGNGLMYWLLDMVPFIGIVVAPINALTGAGTGLAELEKTEN